MRGKSKNQVDKISRPTIYLCVSGITLEPVFRIEMFPETGRKSMA